MPKLDAFDYSWSRPSPTAMRAAGIEAVSRYLWSGGKGIDHSERAALHSAGIGIVLNFEAQPGDHLLGAWKGRANGETARTYARALGAPKGTPIYYSCDREVFDSQMPTVLAYLEAADDADYPSRCYAQASVVRAYKRPAWLTLAWSGGDVPGNAVFYQYAINQTFRGSAVDYCTILNRSELGAWWPAGQQPTPPSQPKDERMFVFQIDQASVPHGHTAARGWFLYDHGQIVYIDQPAGRTNNGNSMLKACGQTAVLPITFAFYQRLGGK